MKQILQLNVIAAMCCFMSFSAVAQTGSIAGKVFDEDNSSLPGASVYVQGTSLGTITDYDGQFIIDKVPVGKQTIKISFIGYSEMDFEVNIVEGQKTSISDVTMESSALGLQEIEVIASVAVDRKTPVAVSTIKAAQIESKIGTQEFPEILKSTPGVFATKNGGGYGDGRVSIRGFDDDNVAVLINGIPVNDMENGHVYWSNWAGLTDAASSIQVQRGLGASKVAVPSIGGTINILSKASDLKKGGYVQAATGNNNYSKIGFSVSSGLTDNGWAFTVAGGKTQGDGYADGLQFEGFSYFTNIAKQINKSHEVTFTLVGAKQTHGQRFSYMSLEDLEKNPRGNKLNYDWGYKDGQVVNLAYNYYNKPQLSLNHYWTISDKTELSTALYASFGNGGGRRAQGDLSGSAAGLTRTDGKYGPIDFDSYVSANEANPSGKSDSWLASSVNSHNWYGILSTLNHNLNDNLKILGGLDLRSYKGIHYYEVTDLLGGDYIIRNEVADSPDGVIRKGGRYNKDYVGNVFWTGLFGQVEYTKDQLAAFISLSGSNTSYKKEEYLTHPLGVDGRESDRLDYLGYQIKGGANYNLTKNHNVYANLGYFTKAPVWDNVFTGGDRSTVVNEDAENEKILSFEVGYGLRMSDFRANLNVYRTLWKDRALYSSFQDPNTDEIFYANILGVNALHQGIEFDGVYNFSSKLTLTGMLSLGDWTWQNDVTGVYIRDQDGNIVKDQNGDDVDPTNVYISGLKVGNSAQTTAALGFNYKLLDGLSVGMDYNYYDNLYAGYNPTNNDTPEKKVQTWQMPSYGLLDLNIGYNFEIAGLKSSLYGNINNILNTEYVADASGGIDAQSSSFHPGFGTTWSLTAKIRF